MGCGCGCNETNSRNGADGVGISSIVDLHNGSFKIILTTTQEYTISIPIPSNGTNGTDGVNGLSAYQLAVNAGFVGNMAAWLLSLKGTDGIGTDGIDGTNGINGRTVFSGYGIPSGALGEQNDHYINIDNWNIYKKDESAWSLIGNLKGAQGNAGADGVIGNTITLSINLTIAEDGENENDVLITLDDYNLYGWNGTSWAYQGNIRGTTGATGARGRSQAVYIQDTEPSGGSYFDGDIWIVDPTVIPTPPVDPPVVTYTRLMNMVAVVQNTYDVIPTNNGVITFTINASLPNDLIFVTKIKFLLYGEEETITVTGNIIAGNVSIAVPFNTGDNGGDSGEAPFLGNQPTDICLDSYLSLADVVISNLSTFECL